MPCVNILLKSQTVSVWEMCFLNIFIFIIHFGSLIVSFLSVYDVLEKPRYG